MCARFVLLAVLLSAAYTSFAAPEPVEILRSIEEGTEIVGVTTKIGRASCRERV